MAAKDITGQVFARLTVLYRELDADHLPGHPRWRCRCDCGRESTVFAGHLRSGAVQSCGCLRRERSSSAHLGKRPANYRHGLVRHPLYRVWAGIQRRCENPNDKNYRYYGAKGVSICPQWRKAPEHFIAWALANGWTPHNRLVVSRKGDLGDYSPDNCLLITKSANSSQAALRHRFGHPTRRQGKATRGDQRRPEDEP